MTLSKNNRFLFYNKVIRKAFLQFNDDDIFTQSAALAYFMVFALPSILVIIFWLAGIWFKSLIITETVIDEFAELMGQEGARQLVSTLDELTSMKPSLWATIIGVGTLLFMATTVFVTIKHALNKIFKVDVKKVSRKGVWKFLFDRLVSVAMIGVVAIIITLAISIVHQ